MNVWFATTSRSWDKIMRSRRLMRTPTMQRLKRALMIFLLKSCRKVMMSGTKSIPA